MLLSRLFTFVLLCLLLTSCKLQNDTKANNNNLNHGDIVANKSLAKGVIFRNQSQILKAGFVRMPLFDKNEFNIFIHNDLSNHEVLLDSETEFFYSGDTHIPYILRRNDTISVEIPDNAKVKYILTSKNLTENKRINFLQEAINKGIPLFYTEIDNQQNKLVDKKKLLNNVSEISNINNIALNFYSEYFQNSNEDYKMFFKEYLKFDNYIKIFTYCTDKKIIDSLYKVNYFDFKAQQKNKYFNTNYSYFGALYQSFLHKYKKNLQIAPPLVVSSFLDSFYNKEQSDIIKLFYLKNYGLDILSQNSSTFAQVLETVSNEDYKKYLTNIFLDYNYQKNLKDKISDLNGKEYSFKFLTSNSDKRLKYIDFWASWCGPCREEFRYYPGLIDKFTTGEIEFVTISIDQSESSWRKALIKENLGKQFNNYFYPNPSKANISAFKLETIPRYIIVGQKGKILNFDAPRPSDPALIPLLQKLLKETTD